MSPNHHRFQRSQAINLCEIRRAKAYAFRIFGLYCLIFYCVPFLLFMARGNALELFLTARPNYVFGIFYVLSSFILYAIVLQLPTARIPRMGVVLARIAFDPRLSFIYSALFIAFTMATRNQMGLSFRQTGGSLNDLGAIGFILQISKAYFGIAILVHYRMIYESSHPKLRMWSLLFIGVGFMISMQAAYDVLFVFCAIIAAGVKWRRVFGLHLNFVRRISVVIIPIIMLTAFFVGTANKVGIDEALRLLADTDYIFRAMVNRLGYHFFSTSLHVSENFLNFRLFFEAIQNVFGTLSYRASILLGIDGVVKPEVVSIARMNFLQLGPEWRALTGASPSVLGSTFFLPGAGLAILYYIFIIRGVAIMIGRIMSPVGDNILFLLLSVVIFGGVFDAFLDNLNPFSPGFVRLFILFLAVTYVLDFLRRKTGPRDDCGVELL